MSTNLGSIAQAAAQMAHRKKSHSEIVFESVGNSIHRRQQQQQHRGDRRGSGSNHRDDGEADTDEEGNSPRSNSVMDLKEFAHAVRTFPETILKVTFVFGWWLQS